MRKFSFIVSTLGGAVLGYLASNKKLREELSKAKNAVAAREVLVQHLRKDGKSLGHELRSLLENWHLSKKIQGAQALLQQQFHKAEGELHHFFDQGKSTAGK